MIQTAHRPLMMIALSLAVWAAVVSFGPAAEAQESAASAAGKQAPLTAAELEALVGPIALYPDDLVSIVLPASTYPLQIVQAARYLEEHKTNAALKPDEDWDDSIVALLNYPEVVDLMNADLDWTWELGRAVLYQKSELMDAIQEFRGRAYAAGNLQSDDRQIVTRHEQTIVIEPADPTVIYLPYYQPEQVVVYHSYPVYHYYPRAYPVYYYPYPYGRWFGFGFFWGVTLAFSIDWHSHHVHAYHHHHQAHPYHGHDYHYSWYRQHSPSVSHGENIWRPGYKSGSRQHHVASVHVENRSLGATSASKAKYRNQTERRLQAPGFKSGKRSTDSATVAHRRSQPALSIRPKSEFQKRREKSPGAVSNSPGDLGRSKKTALRSSPAATKRGRPNSKPMSLARSDRQIQAPRSKSGKRSTESAAAAHRRSQPALSIRPESEFQKRREKSPGAVSKSPGDLGRSKKTTLRSSPAATKRGRPNSKPTSPARRYSGVRSTQSSDRRSAGGGVYKKKDQSSLASPRNVSTRQGTSRSVSRETRSSKGIGTRSRSSLDSGGHRSFQSSAPSSFGGRYRSRAGSPSTGLRRN